MLANHLAHIEMSLFQKLLMWASRITLISSTCLMTYVVTRPSYNYAHWVPHSFLRSIGIPYSALLWFETNGDSFLHFFGAALLSYLLISSQIRYISSPPIRAIYCVISICIAAEVTQFLIGRGFEINDLLLGILGSFMAYLTIIKYKQMTS